MVAYFSPVGHGTGVPGLLEISKLQRTVLLRRGRFPYVLRAGESLYAVGVTFLSPAVARRTLGSLACQCRAGQNRRRPVSSGFSYPCRSVFDPWLTIILYCPPAAGGVGRRLTARPCHTENVCTQTP